MGANGSAIKIMLDPELKGLKGLKSGMAKAMAESTLVLSRGMNKTFDKSIREHFKKVSDQVEKIEDLKADLAKAGIDEATKQLKTAALEAARKQHSDNEKEFKEVLRRQNKELRTRQEAFEKMGRSQASIKGAGDMGKKIGDEIKSAFDDVFKSKDLGKMLEGTLGRVGKGATAAGGALMKSESFAGLGKFLSMLGPAISALSAVAMGFVAIFKIFMDADAHMKELNKTMMEGGTVANDLVDRYGRIGPSLNQVTKHFASAVRLSWELGTTAKENIQILSAYGGANVSIEKLSGGLKNASVAMENLERATIGAVAYARLFGTSYTEMATNFGDYMTRLGLTLQGVEERFSAIAVAARDSGFSTKRFMGTLLQATSGMSMYNVRIEETAGLLVSLGQILGEKMGGEFLQNLTQGLRGESAQDLTKRVLVTGEGTTRRIGQKAAAADAADLKRKVEAAGVNPKIAETLQQAGIDLSKSPEEIAKAIGMMPEKMADALKTKLSGFDTGIGGAFKGARQAGLSYQGGLGAAVAGARGSGPAATLMMNLSKTVGVLGKTLDEVSETDIVGQMAAEHISGKQGEEMMQYRAVGKEFQQRADELKRQSDLVAKGGDATEFNKTLGKSWGTFIDESGRWFKGAQGMETEEGKRVYIDDKSREGLVMASGEELTRMTQTDVDENLDIASEVADNTRSIQDILENGVAAVLSTINDTLSNLFGWIAGGDVKGDILKMMEKVTQELEVGSEGISRARGELYDLQDKYKASKNPMEREALRSQILAKKGEIQQREKGQRVGRAQMKDIRGLRTEEDVEKYRGGKEIKDWTHWLSTSWEDTKPQLASDIAKNAQERIAAEDRVKTSAGASPEVQRQAAEMAEATAGYMRKVAKDKGWTLTDKNIPMEDLKSVYQQQQAAKEAAARTGLPQDEIPGLGIGRTGTTTRQIAGLSDENTLIQTQDEISAEQAAEMHKKWLEDKKTTKLNVKKEVDTQKNVGRDLQTGADKNAEMISKTMKDISETEQAKALSDMLEKAGMKGDLMSTARSLMGGQAVGMTSEQREALTGRVSPFGQAQRGLDISGPDVGGISSSPTQDMVMQIGTNGRIKFAQRVDANDVGVFSKPSGAIAQAGGGRSGGGSVNVFHLYGEGPGVLNTITKAQSAGLMS